MHTLLSYRSFSEKIKEFYEFFPEKLEEGLRMSAEKLIGEALKEEIDILVDAERYERCVRRKAVVSAQTVSRIAQKLDHEVRLFHQRALGEDYQYLFLVGSHRAANPVPYRSASTKVAVGAQDRARRSREVRSLRPAHEPADLWGPPRSQVSQTPRVGFNWNPARLHFGEGA